MLQLATKHAAAALQNKHRNVFRHKIYLDSDTRCLEAKKFKNILEHSVTIIVSDFHRPSGMILLVDEHMCQVYVFYVARIQKLKQESLMTILTRIVGCLFTFQL